MRVAQLILTGWCLVLYLQSSGLPTGLLLSGMRLAEVQPVCRCKITGTHDRWCRCPCCVGHGPEVAPDEGDSRQGPERAGSGESKSCCRVRGAHAASRCSIAPAGCGCGPRTEAAVGSPSFSFYLAEDGIAVSEPSWARFAPDSRMALPYSVLPELPDKIPI